MTIKVGDRVPDVTLRRKMADGVEEVATGALFAGKTAVVFGLPGAFTPTCSARHAPGYIDNAGALRAKGVDLVACVSVNDAFVMDAWGKDLGADGKVEMLADGNGDFAAAAGLEMDGSGFGMGKRSRRYAMVVRDGVVSTLAVEDGPGLDVSAAEKILAAL